MQFIQARNYTPVRGAPRAIRLIVIHTMEAPEKPGTALSVAHWFAGPSAPQASAHYCLDATDEVQCVHEQDVAWAAPGANNDGIHIEHAGFASQTAIDWADDYSVGLLERSARLCAHLCNRFELPAVKLDPEGVLAGLPGICGHVDVTKAYRKSTHTDPGKGFPWATYLGLVSENLRVLRGELGEPPSV